MMPFERETMISLVLEEIGRLVVAEDVKPAPGAGEVRVRVAVTGICGSDIHGYTGENGRRFPGQVMGHEASGWIDQIGPDSEEFGLSLNQPVTFNPLVVPLDQAENFRGREQHCPDRYVIGVKASIPAAFATHVIIPSRNIVPLGPDVPVEHGALVEPLAVGVHAVRRVMAEPDTRCLVIGGGPIGQAVVLALKMAGVGQIYVSEVDSARRDLVEQLGARALDPLAEPLTTALDALGGPVGVTFDAVGTDSSVADALSTTTRGGRICLVGMGSPAITLNAFRISTDERSLVGSFTYSGQDFLDAAEYVSRASKEMSLLISREVSPAEADSAFRSLAKGDGTPGKVLVRFNA
ncbi:zinc-dependent alcohol dehydrogenase [Pseudactinotalea sp. Z1748]|uniref:zinc-dependent alcohol dehydrogenase n=1 Tax=Pseudactinotalea sp. Z1748 TaxID=3413027 RepID=UPI003C7BAEC6